MQKYASVALPVDTSQWGEFMRAELVNRLSRIEPLIERFKLIESNEEGFGLGLFFLEGGRVFIPVVSQEWKIQPIDIIIYKSDNKTEFCYLCERNLHLMQSLAFGKPQGRKAGNVFNSYVNLFSPSGGYGERTTNPYNDMYSGRGSISKTASVINLPEIQDSLEYAIKEIRKTNILDVCPDIEDHIQNLESPVVSNFSVYEPVDSDSVLVYDEESPEGRMADLNDVIPTFRSSSNFSEKTASLLGGSLTTMGSIAGHRNYTFLEPMNHSEATSGEKMDQVIHEGIFYFGDKIAYINPNMIYLDGTPTHDSLVVGKGFYSREDNSCLAGRVSSTNSVESAQVSKDVIMPLRNQVKTGGIYAIYNRLDKSITVPFKVLLPVEDDRGVISSMVVQPLEGTPVNVTIRWYNGQRVIDRGSDILYPRLESEVYSVPDSNLKDMSGFFPESKKKELCVGFSKGASSVVDITENDKMVKRTTKLGELLYFLIKRYGFSKSQSVELIKKILREKNISIVTDVIEFHTKQNPLSSMMKEAITSALSFANRLTKVAAAPNPQEQMPPGGQNPNQTQTPESLSVNGQQQDPNDNPVGQDKLSKIRTVSSMAKDVIEMLSYYALGEIRKEELSSLYGSLQNELKSLENSISKILLLSQLKKTVGIDYTEIKMVLSDIDGFINKINSAKVLEDI